jgi:uncharacterized membrane protein YozB (DUF420 family)
MLLAAAHPLVHVNATLNALATVLLIVGYLLIKRGRVMAHKRVMLSAFAVSTVFLLCYLWYHYQVGRVEFTHPGIIKVIYLVILASHILLAAAVPVLAIWTIYLGLRATGSFGRGDAAETGQDLAVYRAKHRRVARWTYPIWLYVSVTGVVVYVMLYHLWPPADL